METGRVIMANNRDLSACKYLAIGGGNFRQDGWINLDYPFERRAGKQHPVIDVEHNLMSMDPLPFPDNKFNYQWALLSRARIITATKFNTNVSIKSTKVVANWIGIV